jgi:hypothetical protein
MSSKKTKPSVKSKKPLAAKSGPQPPYGPAIRDAIAHGNLKDMKSVAARARKHIAELQRSLDRLEARIEKLGG